MRKDKDAIPAAARNIRVTRDGLRPPFKAGRHVGMLIAAPDAMHRLRRRPALVTAIDMALRRTSPGMVLRPLTLQNHIELAPRLLLTLRPERCAGTLERQIETRLLWQPRSDSGASAAVEHIVRLAAACAGRCAQASREGVGHQAGTEARDPMARDGNGHQDRPAGAVPVGRRPPAIGMALQRARPAAPAAPENAPAPPGMPQQAVQSGRWPVPGPAPATAPLDAACLRTLTDSVVEALGRRAVAAQERTGRRSA